MILELPILLDGATGTELQKRGFSGEGCAEAWTLAHPEAIVELQRAYVQNGSQIVYSPTFGANRVKLESHGLFGKVEEYNRQLVALSRRAAGDAALVAGDISPTGLFLYPLGETTFEELFDVYAEQAAALEAAGVDLFVVETMVTLAEARAAVLAVRSVSSKPVFVSFSCDEQGKTLSGTDITAAALVMQGMGISAFGMNCSTGPVQMLPHLQRLSRYAQVPLLAKPNAGLPQVENGKTVYHCPPQEFAACAGDMAAAGVGIFGGCCGTTPEHIAALADRLRGQAVAPPAFAFDELLPCATGQRALPLSRHPGRHRAVLHRRPGGRAHRGRRLGRAGRRPFHRQPRAAPNLCRLPAPHPKAPVPGVRRRRPARAGAAPVPGPRPLRGRPLRRGAAAAL